MSLVNKMLRDLDARRVGDGERAALPAAVTPLAAHQEARPMLPRLLLAGLALVVLAVAAWYAMQNSAPPPSAMPPGVVAPPAVAAPPPVVAAAPIAAAPAPAVEAAAAVVPPAPAEPAAAPAAVTAPAPVAALPTLRMADALVALPEVKSEPARKPPTAPAKPAPPALPAVATVTPATEGSPRGAPTSKPPVPEPTPRPAPVVAPKAAPPAEVLIEKQLRQPSAAERAEVAYRRGLAAARQGLTEDAIGIYRSALADQAEHAAARQALAALLIEARRYDEAEDVLRKGTDTAAARLPSALALARLQVERNQAAAALETLQLHATAGERSAEYQGFSGALLNRAGRTGEAVAHYQAATRLAPGEGRWWAGLGIALDAAGKGAEAREAYQKARSTPGLPADLAQHVEQRLR